MMSRASKPVTSVTLVPSNKKTKGKPVSVSSGKRN
nr:MAG TPA: hypothetical protein [Caudoviricetes sp.]